jgi:hypothetical protein
MGLSEIAGEFLFEIRSNIYKIIIAGFGAAVVGGWGLSVNLAGPVSFVLGLVAGSVIFHAFTKAEERKDIAVIKDTVNVLAGAIPSLTEVEAALTTAENLIPTGEGFAFAAKRRAYEADYKAKHGKIDHMITGTGSLTFEHIGRQNAARWEEAFNLARLKLQACGIPV